MNRIAIIGNAFNWDWKIIVDHFIGIVLSNRRNYRTCVKSIQNLSLRQLLLIIVSIIIIWLCLLLFLCDRNKSHDDQLKNEIIDLSKKYVNALALQQHHDVDGPYAGRFTGYDLKKTFAVLLQNMLERLDSLENKVYNLTNGGNWYRNNSLKVDNNRIINNNGSSKTFRNPLESRGLIAGPPDDCLLDTEMKLRYPECDEKIEWMTKHWRSHTCYKDNGVDGSLCSITIFLSEVESYCPRLPFREVNIRLNESDSGPRAEINVSLTALLGKLGNGTNTDVESFVKVRIRRLWPKMLVAVSVLNKTTAFRHRSMKSVVLYMGFLSKASKLKMSEGIFKGGPLGELVQWTDLITALHIAGHEVIIFSEFVDIVRYISDIPNFNIPCQAKLGARLNILYTDIIGFNQIRAKLTKFKCIVRILDTFGTQPIFNNNEYMKKHNIKINGWMGKVFELKQFYNMYPHTPDNTFLGFIVESPPINTVFRKKKIALVYGKHISMWKNAQPYIDVIKQYFDIHATVADGSDVRSILPDYVVNHGLLFGDDYTSLLQQAMVFIGLGFPYEGPAPLEAIANGVVFLNPKFSSEDIENASKFFYDKPTNRTLTSQHPYIERYVGEPYSYLVDTTNATQVAEICHKVINRQLTKGMVPFEFTEEGFIQRVCVLTEKQNFCRGSYVPNAQEEADQWPSVASAHFFLGIVNESCEATCVKQGLICEASYIERMMNNRLELQQRGVWCENVKFTDHPVHPSYNPYTKTCFFQTDHFLYSCSDTLEDHMRFCGCRDFIPGQSALCRTCL